MNFGVDVCRFLEALGAGFLVFWALKTSLKSDGFYCRRGEFGVQHAFYPAPAIKDKMSIAPRNYVLTEMSYSSSFLKHPFLPATEKTMVFELLPEALFAPATENTWFCKENLFPQQKNHGF